MLHLTPKNSRFPRQLLNISRPPRELYIEGDLSELLKRPSIAIVGSRKVSKYGHIVTEQLTRGLVARGVVTISGLALGVDSIAHRASIDMDGYTIAVIPSGLNNIYPVSHRGLAGQILKKGGALISEYPPHEKIAYKSNFIARNRIIASLAQAVLITEANANSGSLHTANFALEQGKDVLSVPGPITSPGSMGCNNLIKSGATPVTSIEDILNCLGINSTTTLDHEIIASSELEYKLLNLIKKGSNDIDDLQIRSGLTAEEFQQTLSLLEIKGRIIPVGGGQWVLK